MDRRGPPGPALPIEILQYHLASVAALDSAGVTILAGSDPPTSGVVHGIGLLQELELLVRAGLTPTEALGAATARTAEAFGLGDRGRIASSPPSMSVKAALAAYLTLAVLYVVVWVAKEIGSGMKVDLALALSRLLLVNVDEEVPGTS